MHKKQSTKQGDNMQPIKERIFHALVNLAFAVVFAIAMFVWAWRALM